MPPVSAPGRAPAIGRAHIGRLLFLGLLPLLLIMAPPAGAAGLALVGVTAPGLRPAPDYPIPNDAGMVFYMQRSTNSNTVVYAARFGPDGALDRGDPITAYWRRYNSDGAARKLSLIERKMAYGVTASERAPGVFDIHFRAIPEIPLRLEQGWPGQAVLSIAPAGERIDLTYGYLEVDESGLIPSVTGIDLFGTRRADGQPVRVTYDVQGG